MNIQQKRTCGACTACCKTHPVREILKPQGEWCMSCDIGRGCKIYDARPKGCREFECQWLKGLGTEEDRPDKTRIVTDCVYYESIGKTLMLFELSSGFLDKDFAALQGLLALEKGYAVLTVPMRGGCTLLVSHEKFVPEQFLLEDGRRVTVKRV